MWSRSRACWEIAACLMLMFNHATQLRCWIQRQLCTPCGGGGREGLGGGGGAGRGGPPLGGTGGGRPPAGASCAMTAPKLKSRSRVPNSLWTGLKGSRVALMVCSSKMEFTLAASMPVLQEQANEHTGAPTMPSTWQCEPQVDWLMLQRQQQHQGPIRDNNGVGCSGLRRQKVQS